MAAAKRGKTKPSKLRKAASAAKGLVGTAVRKVSGKAKPAQSGSAPPRSARAATKSTAAARKTRREADIPLEKIAAAYTPKTSLKAGFRATGADRQRDQEFSRGVADDAWNDEDHYTNKSGDPRIGTHGRTYEPGEAKTSPRSK